MKQFLRFLTYRFFPVFTAAISLTGLLTSQPVFADVNKLYVTPDNSQMNVGTSFTINVRSYSTSTTGAASGTLLYPKTVFQVTSISVGGSDYGTPTITQGSGSIGFSGTRSPTIGSAQIFSVTFKATSAYSNAVVYFSNDSQLGGMATSYGSGTYTVTTPPSPPPSSSPSPTTKPSSTPKPSSSPAISTAPVVSTPVTAPGDTAPDDSASQESPDPTGVVNSVVTQPSYTSVRITWKVTAPNPSTSITYGSDSATLDKDGTVKNEGNSGFSATISDLKPGQRYYFSIIGAGTKVSPGAYSSSFQTTGFPVTITVTENGQPANGAQIQIGSSTYTTHADGKVTIGLAAGSYNGKIITSTATSTINLTVVEKVIPSNGTPPEAQPFSFNLTSTPTDNGSGVASSIFMFIGILLGGAAILVVAFFIFINYRNRRFDSGNDETFRRSTSAGPGVIIQDNYDWQEDPEHRLVARGSLETPQTSPPLDAQSNAAYLSEEEPLDMFEKDKLERSETPAKTQPETGQSPNSLHSTTP